MLCRIMSDLHLEFSDYRIVSTEYDNETTLIIAGDIAVSDKEYLYVNLFKDLSARFKNVIFISGNHDYWRGSLLRVPDKMRSYCSEFDNVIYLQNDYVIIDDVLIFGATMWTDIVGATNIYNVECRMNDYRYTRTGSVIAPYQRSCRANDMILEHHKSKVYMQNTLLKMKDCYRKCMVVTHHAPSINSIDERHSNEIDVAYYTPLESFIIDNKIDYWIHGHIHKANEYQIGDCTVLCNPRGYESMNGKEYTGWDETLLFEV